ncbi:MAG TPA: ATP-binding protein [Actinomycetes bacterium]|jgi:signal transduction histidine kinase|nr:ATP-binding protein [Actinomycetes bacterium]
MASTGGNEGLSGGILEGGDVGAARVAPAGPGRVLLVDDHPAMREVLRSLLEDVGGWEVVGEADSGEAALELVAATTPDVVVMDCRMPGGGGVAATRAITHRFPAVAVVAHTAYADEAYVREMVAAGARGYVLKGDSPAAILEALAAVSRGGARLSTEVAGPALDDLRALYEAALARSEALHAENAELAAAVARLTAVDRAKDEFLALVGHELRTPVTVVVGMADTLAARPEVAGTPDGQELVARLAAKAHRLGALVEQLLAASAYAVGRSPALMTRPVAVAELVAECVTARRAAVPALPLALVLPEAPRPVAADPTALRAVLEALLDNAAKAAPPGTEVTVTVAQPEGWTRITVTDQGAGVAPADRDRIFRPFTQVDAGLTRRAGGLGLGLFLVKRLVAGMGGRVEVDDNPGGGACFTVELPDPAPPASVPATVSPPATRLPGSW